MGLETAYCKVCPMHAKIGIRDFFYETRYIFLFYVIGDIATTVFALESELGYEANSIISGFLANYGYASLVLIKLLFLFICFLDYVYLKKCNYLSTWNATRHCVSLLGILLVVNNILVIGGAGSPLDRLLDGY
ncbi:DUF5658 family protein [Methanolobus chelungpuianus]|uniref:DUF5658 domain-containing protein n=1 Tax=Methanolobus chelungpuianus TaxID=502115 RepID=A0AAE3HCI6_9EURY|nr:DUF5658 family protein [Methanolobus chelungpuianus]MCQ6963513.1 hypothetical protein [Methanolobus chelungpuianus]